MDCIKELSELTNSLLSNYNVQLQIVEIVIFNIRKGGE